MLEMTLNRCLERARKLAAIRCRYRQLGRKSRRTRAPALADWDASSGTRVSRLLAGISMRLMT